MTTTSVTPAPAKNSWNDYKAKLRSKFSILTDADVNFEEAKKDEMLAAIQKKVGKNKEQLASIISSL